MLLEVLKENFEKIFVCDAEFICDIKDKAKDPMLFVSCLKKYYPVILTDIMKIV